MRRTPLLLAGWFLTSLLPLTVQGAEARPKAVVFAWDDGGSTAKALGEAGLNAVVPPKQTVGSVDLGDARLVVVSADVALPDPLAARIAELVRGGGGLLVVHTSKDPNFWWTAYRRVDPRQINPSPLWDALPFTQVPITDQEKGGIRNPFGPTRVLRQADSPLLTGVDLRQAPAFPRHGFMVLPTHPILQGTHLVFGWSEDQYKSPLWGNGQVLAWGDDPEQRPLLLAAEYGAGRGVAAAVPLFNPAFLQWPGSKTLIGNVTRWLLSGNGNQSALGATGSASVFLSDDNSHPISTGKASGTLGAGEPAIYGVGVPWIVQDSLRRMGLRVTGQSAGATGAVVYDVPNAEQAQAVAALAKAGRPVVVANPEALKVAPLGGLVKNLPSPSGRGAGGEGVPERDAASPHPGPLPAGEGDHAPRATAPPAPIVDAKPLEKQNKVMLDGVWAVDPGNVGTSQGWFTPEGAARAKWVAELPAEGNSPTLAKQKSGKSPAKKAARVPAKQKPGQNQKSKKSPAADASPNDISWSKTYRWRFEGNLLDRRDFVEGWQRPDYDDSAWAQQSFGQEPSSPKLVGQQTPAPSLMSGAVWARAKFTLANPPRSQGSRHWLVPSDQPAFVTLLDGKPLREKVDLGKLSVGEHLVALRAWPLHAVGKKGNYDPWGTNAARLQWPTVAADPVAAGANTKGTIWYKVNVHLTADSRWNAIQFDQPPAAVLYINGKRIPGSAGSPSVAPWRAGDNLLVLGNLSSPNVPTMQLAQIPTQPAAATVPAAERLAGVWYQRVDPAHEALAQGWPAALSGATPPAGWTPITPDAEQGTLAGTSDRRSDSFAAPFLVSAAEAHGPALLVINATGGAVPTDLIKTVWVNGQPVQAQIEFASTQRYGLGEAAPAKGRKHAKGAGAAKGGNRGGNAKGKPGGKVAPSAEPIADDEPAAKEEPTDGDGPMASAGAMIKGSDKDADKQTIITFILSGRLKPGLNWLAFSADLQDLYRLRIAVPAGSGWTVPLPKLDFSGRVDTVAWAQPLSRLGGAGLVRRGNIVMPPPDATVLARFSDGAPAVARVGNITFATSDQSRDWSRWIDEAVRIDWTAIKEARTERDVMSTNNMKRVNAGSGDPVQADGAQVPASLLRHPRPASGYPGTRPAILGAEPAGDGAVVRLTPANEPRWLSYQLRNWMGMVLSEGRLPVPAGAERVVVPAPTADPSPLTTRLRADRWLRAALLQSGGASVCDYLETRVDARPAVEVLLAPSDGLDRDLPPTIPGSPTYDPRNLTWSLVTECPASPVVVPGERIRLRAMCRNTTARPQQVALNLAWEGAMDNRPVALRTLRFTLAPYEQRTELVPCGFRVADMRFVPLAGETKSEISNLRSEIAHPTGDLVTGRLVARAGDAVVSELALVAVRPWKQFAPYPERLPSQQGAPAEYIVEQFWRTPSLESLNGPPQGFAGKYTGDFYAAKDWQRDHMVTTRGNGGGFGGFHGTDDLAWGPYDDAFDDKGACLDNAGYLPDGTQYQEFLYASISREYNRFIKGTKPLQMEVADFWESGGTAKRERNLIHFLRWRFEQGRPLTASTVSQLKQLIEQDPVVAEDWRIFVRDAYLAWGRQYMAGLPPHSINASQGGSENYRFGRLHDDLAAFRSVLQTHNCGFTQPANLRRRGELPFAGFRAVDPGCLVADNTWHKSGGHSQTIGGSWGSSGSVFASPEFSRMMYLDYGLMAVRDDQGRAAPMINLPPSFRGSRPMPLFTTSVSGFQFPADGLVRDVTSRFDHLIQAERVLGAYIVPSLERAANDKLDGTTVKRGAYVTDVQPEMGLTHVLRNFGALWGGTIAPDRVDRLQPGEAAIYIMPSGAGDAEAKPMADFVRNGGRLSVFFSTGGTKKQETALSDLFGVKYAPLAEDVQGTMQLDPSTPAVPYDADTYGGAQYVSARPGDDRIIAGGGLAGRVLLRNVEAGKGRAVFSSMNADLSWGWDHDLARKLAQAVNWAAGNPVTLPDGVGGYAFEAKGMTFLVLEDLKYTGGPAEIHVKLPPGNYWAADVFSGLPVKVERREDGIVIHPTLLPNGGSLVVVRKADSAMEK